MNKLLSKTGNDRDVDLLRAALQTLEQETSLKTRIIGQEILAEERVGAPTVSIQSGDKQLEYWVEVKPALTAPFIGRLMQQLPTPIEKWLIITRYIPKEMARLLQSLNLQYLDTVGNAYMKRGSIYIHISGKAMKTDLALRDANVPYGAGVLKVIFALLVRDKLRLQPYREIAKAAGVSLGTVSNAIVQLQRKGYLLDLGEQRLELVEKSKLAADWVDGYTASLRPKCLIGRFVTDATMELQSAKLEKFDAQWGGESAAAHLSDYLKPGVTTIYVGEKLNELLLAFRLRRQNDGLIEIRQRFWGFENVSVNTPSLLTYADLLATGEARNIETGKVIYDRFVRETIEQA